MIFKQKGLNFLTVETLRERYLNDVKAAHLSNLRKSALVSTHKDIYVFDPLVDGLDDYIEHGASVWQGEPEYYGDCNGIDIDRGKLFRYLVSAKGFQDPKSEIAKMAKKIYACLHRAEETGKMIRFNTTSPAFLRYSNEEIVIHLIEGMIVEMIPIPHYFDGMKLIKRAAFSEIEWVQYEELKQNRMEMNRITNGKQP